MRKEKRKAFEHKNNRTGNRGKRNAEGLKQKA
jgi:hypothetical protein